MNRLYAKIRHQREDRIHKMTSDMTEKYDEIMIEDLNVSGMVMDRDLNAAINIMAAGSAPEAENGCGEDV